MNKKFWSYGGHTNASSPRVEQLATLNEGAIEMVAGGAGREQVELNPPSSVDAWAPPGLPEISGPPERLYWYGQTM